MCQETMLDEPFVNQSEIPKRMGVLQWFHEKCKKKEKKDMEEKEFEFDEDLFEKDFDFYELKGDFFSMYLLQQMGNILWTNFLDSPLETRKQVMKVADTFDEISQGLNNKWKHSKRLYRGK